jgi:hypothetical protein
MNGIAGYEPTTLNSLEIVNRQIAAEKFNRLNLQAQLANFWRRLTGHPKPLLSYEHMRAQSNQTTSLDRGVKSIPVKSIVGSVNRAEDYDRQFRPLNRDLKSRWINIYMLSESLGWEPIIVHKIGDRYFVEDGHHRVSVARHSGFDTIEAHVYE